MLNLLSLGWLYSYILGCSPYWVMLPHIIYLIHQYILFKGLSDPTIDAFPMMYIGLLWFIYTLHQGMTMAKMGKLRETNNIWLENGPWMKLYLLFKIKSFWNSMNLNMLKSKQVRKQVEQDTLTKNPQTSKTNIKWVPWVPKHSMYGIYIYTPTFNVYLYGFHVG